MRSSKRVSPIKCLKQHRALQKVGEKHAIPVQHPKNGSAYTRGSYQLSERKGREQLQNRGDPSE